MLEIRNSDFDKAVLYLYCLIITVILVSSINLLRTSNKISVTSYNTLIIYGLKPLKQVKCSNIKNAW